MLKATGTDNTVNGLNKSATTGNDVPSPRCESRTAALVGKPVGVDATAAQGEAARFNQLVTQIQTEAESGRQDYAAVRHLAMRRMYLDTIGTIFAKVAAKVVLDSGRPVDLTILRESGK